MEPKITLQFTQQGLVTVVTALEQMPYKSVAVLLVDLQAQITAFNKTSQDNSPVDTPANPKAE